MPGEFIEKMGKYIAYLQRQYDSYRMDERDDLADFFATKLCAARDICVMFKCVKEVFNEAKRVYGGNQ